jgi:hypothetical protein
LNGTAVRALLGYGPRLLAKKVASRLRRELRIRTTRIGDILFGSHGRGSEGVLPVPLRIDADDLPSDLRTYLAAVAPSYLDHRFDFLGSGWTQVRHGVRCRGLEGNVYPPGEEVDADHDGHWLVGKVSRTNLSEAQRIWRLIDAPDYRPIDWQLDFKSGYRWSELDYFTEIRIGPAPGADIKLPWELARMQHLPQLALCLLRAVTGDERFERPERYQREIEAQILDFIATNPPRYGANWVCPMDAAIRIANWLLTLDLLAVAGRRFTPEVMVIVSRSVTDHVAHIVDHLEWSESNRTNHYLSDIVGLLYASARMSPSARSDALLAFAVHELVTEASVQFHEEGSCYEGSTGYHRLSAELLLFGAAITAGLTEARLGALERYSSGAISVRPPFPRPPLSLYSDAGGKEVPLPPEFVARLWRAARFTEAVTRPDGNVCQIGDNDSGRLFWLHPFSKEGMPTARSDLDHGALTDAVDALFSEGTIGSKLDARVVRALAGGWQPSVPDALPGLEDFGDPEELLVRWWRTAESGRRVRRVPLLPSTQAWDRIAFPAFGLYVLRRANCFVAFRCAGFIPSGTPTGHLHDDNLGIEVMIDGQLIVADPGTYVYTPLPELRNAYRGANAHDVPRASHWAVAPAGKPLFSLSSRYAAECLCWRSDSVAGQIESEHGALMRLIRLNSDCVEIYDAVAPGELVPLGSEIALCDGYGRKA